MVLYVASRRQISWPYFCKRSCFHFSWWTCKQTIHNDSVAQTSLRTHKLILIHAYICCMWTEVSFAVCTCTQHNACPVIGKGNKKAGALVVCIDGWTCHEPMQGLLRRVGEHDFSSHDDFERGRRREMSSLKNEREDRRELAARNCSTTTMHVHLRSVARHRPWFLTAPFCF